jgi:anti-sigma regulatory factor (Ser/Thr protein kinase)
VRLEFRDAGAPFNPLDTPLPDLTSPPEKRGIGGLGVHLVSLSSMTPVMLEKERSTSWS